MADESIYERLKAAMITAEIDNLLAATDAALEQGVQPLDIIEKGLGPAMREIGESFRRYEIYLPEMMMAAEAWEQAMRILEPKISANADEHRVLGRVVIGTVKGDVHSLGKNIVVTMLKTAGFEVFDLGTDVPASAFAAKADEVGADVVAISALMTTTMPQQKSVIEHLEARGVRERYYVLVGGGSTTQEWADEIGADGYGETAADGVALALEALDQKRGRDSK